MPMPTDRPGSKGTRFMEKSFPFAPGDGVTAEDWDAIFGAPKPGAAVEFCQRRAVVLEGSTDDELRLRYSDGEEGTVTRQQFKAYGRKL